MPQGPIPENVNEEVCLVFGIKEAKALLRQAAESLRKDPLGLELPPLGVMVEVPAAVFQARALARRVDFLSVGSNDLTQYLLAVDRNNSRVANLYQTLHPAVLLAIRQVIDEAHGLGKPVSVCGEMAGDPAAALALLGLGIDSLSMNASNLPRVKWVIRSFTASEARQLVDRACAMEDPVAIRKLYNSVLEQGGLGGLVRAGN